MPSFRLSSGAVDAPTYAIFGIYAPSVSGIVSHVGLIAEQTTISPNLPIQAPICEMNPPLQLGVANTSGSLPRARQVVPNVIGWIELSVDQRDGITDWMAGLRSRFAARMPPPGPNEHVGAFISRSHYSVHPAYRKARIDTVTGREIHEYFNCVGFVLACYDAGAGIKILVDPSATPVSLAGLKTIARVYGQREARMVDRYRKILEIGDGPWPILFGGYILHAFKDNPPSLPHHPRFIEIRY